MWSACGMTTLIVHAAKRAVALCRHHTFPPKINQRVILVYFDASRLVSNRLVQTLGVSLVQGGRDGLRIDAGKRGVIGQYLRRIWQVCRFNPSFGLPEA